MQANLVVAEMRDPNRDLPRAVHTAIPMVTICFVLTNIAYYIILPWRIIPSSDAIAVVFAAPVPRDHPQPQLPHQELT